MLMMMRIMNPLELSVYKSRGPFVPLYLCTGSRSYTCGRARQGRGSKDTRLSRQRPSQKHKEQRDKVGFPRQEPCRGGLRIAGKSLAGATYPTPARPPPLSLRVPTPTTHWNEGSGRASMVACRSL